ncbi:MAG: P63C domain-containing protein [Candidatus Aminicenantes bacterium]|nr:P63C domain-containing protein [Candidatus Aminicenantes bacterium]
MEENILKAAFGSPDRPLKIGSAEIPCYVLVDGRRVLALGGMLGALDLSYGSAGKSGGADRLTNFISGKAIKPFINDDLRVRITSPLKFKSKGGVSFGYEATILPDICDAILEARKANVLQAQQKHIAEQCEILVRSFARVGIIALVDEATGYQEIRDKIALQEILSKFISQELMKWQKRFPDEFYKELFRLKGIQFNPLPDKKPWIIGRITKDVIYERLAPGVISELEKKNPPNEKGARKHRHHQWLTSDIGHPKLAEQISNVITLMKASSSYNGFYRLLQRSLPKLGDTLSLPMDYPEDKN